MRARKESVAVELTSTLHLEIKGYYTPEEPMIWTYSNGDPGHPGSPSEFEIKNIELVKGTFDEFMDWNDSWLYSETVRLKSNINNRPQSLFEYLSEKCIEKIES